MNAMVGYEPRARPVVLPGHSMGGTSGLLAAAAAPERVKGLALFDPVVFTPSQRPSAMGDNPLAEGALRRRALFPSKAAAGGGARGRGRGRAGGRGEGRAEPEPPGRFRREVIGGASHFLPMERPEL